MDAISRAGKALFLLWMLHCITLACLASAASDDNFSSDLMSLNFYPHLGVFELVPHITTTLSDHSSSSTGTNTATAYNQFFFGAVYGVHPRWRMELEDTFLWDQLTDGGTSPALSAGPSNPAVTVQWRYLEDGDTGLSGDFSERIAPSMGAKIPSNATLNTTGNNLEGGSSIRSSSQLYWRLGVNELELAAGATRFFNAQTNGSNSTNTFQTDPYWTYDFTVADRLHLGARFFLGASFTYTIFNNETEELANGTDRAVQTSPHWDCEANFGYRPEPYYALVLSAIKDHTNTTTVPASGSNVNSTNKSLLGQLNFLHQFWISR